MVKWRTTMRSKTVRWADEDGIASSGTVVNRVPGDERALMPGMDEVRHGLESAQLWMGVATERRGCVLMGDWYDMCLLVSFN